MRNYIIKRIAQSVLILFCVMFIIYALIRSLPSSFAETMAMQLAQAPGAKPYEEWLAQLNAAYGLDLDIIPGFFTWLSKAVVGNFGDSWKWNVPACPPAACWRPARNWSLWAAHRHSRGDGTLHYKIIDEGSGKVPGRIWNPPLRL